MKEIIQFLKDLNALFDCGAEITFDDENRAVIITGRDYAREKDGTIAEPGAVGGVLEHQASSIERVYYTDVDYDEDKGFKDCLTPLIAKIKADNKRMYDGVENTDRSRQMFGLEIYCNPSQIKREALEERLEEIVTVAIDNHRDELLACMGVPVKEGMHVNKLHRVAGLIENEVQSPTAIGDQR